MGTYQPEYFLQEKVVASDSFAEQTVKLNLDSTLGSDQNLFWQINVDPNDLIVHNLKILWTPTVLEILNQTTVDITIKVKNDETRMKVMKTSRSIWDMW